MGSVRETASDTWRGRAPERRDILPPSLDRIWRQHRELLKNVVSLLATTGITSGMGFAFWTVAAKLYSQTSVGYGAAAVSAMNLLATVGIFGLGTLLIADLPNRRNKAGLIAAALIVSGIGSLILCCIFLLTIPVISGHFSDFHRYPILAFALCAGVVLSAMAAVFDQATIGLLRGGLQLTRNLAFVIARLVLLIAAATLVHDGFGLGITMSWVAAVPVSLVPIVIWLRLRDTTLLPRPDFARIRRLARIAMAHNWLNLAIQAPNLLIPVIVASILAPATNAAFYAAWIIISALFVLPVHLSTVLFAVASANPRVVASKLRFSIRLALVIGIPVMAILALAAHPILSVFGAGYAREAATPMTLLALGYLPGLPRFFYIAVYRARGRIAQAAWVLTAFAALEVGAAVVGTLKDGPVGLALGILAALVVEAIVTTPPVVSAAREGLGRHRLVSTSAGVGARTEAWPRSTRAMSQAQGVGVEQGYDQRQVQAIGILLAMSTPGTIAFPPGRAATSGEAEAVGGGRRREARPRDAEVVDRGSRREAAKGQYWRR